MIANNLMCDTTSWGDDDSAGSDDSTMSIDYREWRKYLKALWLKVLRSKQCFTSQCQGGKLHYKKLLISISGWLARKGYAKKN